MDRQQVTVPKRKKEHRYFPLKPDVEWKTPAAAHAEGIRNRKHDKAQKRISRQSGVVRDPLPPPAIPPLSVCMCVCVSIICYLLGTLCISI